MTQRLDPETRNNDTGLYWTKTRRADPTYPTELPDLATGLKGVQAGDIVWYNKYTDETGVIFVEAGEWVPVACTKILSSATIDGVLESTTVTNIFWTTSGSQIGGSY